MTSRSPTTIGDEKPLGVLTFHLTFLSGPKSIGGFWFSATPDPLGPRNCGQTSDFSPACPWTANNPNTASAINVRMSYPRVRNVSDVDALEAGNYLSFFSRFPS